MPKQSKSASSEIASCHSVDLWHLLAPIFHGDGDGQQRAHDYYEQNGVLVKAKPQEGQRPPADTRQTLQTDQQPSHGLFEKLIAGHSETENHAEYDRDRVSHHDAAHAHRDRDPEAMVRETRVQRLVDALWRWEQIRRPNLQCGPQQPETKQR